MLLLLLNKSTQSLEEGVITSVRRRALNSNQNFVYKKDLLL